MKKTYMQYKNIKTKTFVGTACAIAAGAVLLFSACSLDQEPIANPSELTEGQQTDTTTAAFKDKAAAESYLASLNQMRGNQQYVEKEVLDYYNLGDTHADNSYAGTLDAEVTTLETNSLDATAGNFSRDWTHYMWDLAYANVLINGIEPLHGSGQLSDAEYRNMRSQGMFFRAWQMFRMARIWGAVPIITQVAKTITSKNIEEVYPTYFPARSPIEDVYRQIISDLEYAAQNAPDLDPNDKTKLTKTVAQALLCKVYAEKPVQDYDKVIQYAEQVRNTPGMALEPNYATLWGYDSNRKDCLKKNTSEGILEMQFNAGELNWYTYMFGRGLDSWDSQFTWAKNLTPSRDLINAFNAEGDTVRMNQSIVYYSCTWSIYYPASNYAFMYKMRSRYNNIYLLRLADIILLEAEAYANKGDLQKAAELVNIIRNRAKLPNLTADKTSSKQAMLNAVLNERRLELCFEGERWFDLCRYGKVEEVMNSLCNRDNGHLPLTRRFDANSYLMPLPQSALDQNEKLVQNPGY